MEQLILKLKEKNLIPETFVLFDGANISLSGCHQTVKNICYSEVLLSHL